MNYSRLNLLPVIAHAHGVAHAIICPGSRSAPLVYSFIRFGKIHCHSIVDERSAAFIALGMAQQLQKPVALICTSGTAALNFYPAIAEAYYREIPLLVITADRPPEWIDRQDGQTIHQKNIYEKHIIASYQTEVNIENSLDEFKELIIDACSHFLANRKGPVHINMPFREPFYPKPKEIFEYPEWMFSADKLNLNTQELVAIDPEIYTFTKPLLVVGQAQPNAYQKAVDQLVEKMNLPMIADVTSNVYSKNCIRNYDTILRNEAQLQPDLLITIGTMITSKILKNYIRNHPPKLHIHLGEEYYGDPFGTLNKHINILPEKYIAALDSNPSIGASFLKEWKAADQQAAAHIGNIHEVFSEYTAAKYICTNLPQNCIFHLANSMPIRWANIFGLRNGINVYANRGTSGIDGCTSTAEGSAMVSNNIHILLTGDVAFLYDHNALWNQHFPGNLKIVILNNQGGGIFRLIDGPSQQPELEQFFETKHSRTARHICADFNIAYWEANDGDSMKQGWEAMQAHEGAGVLEIMTDPQMNAEVFAKYRSISI
jgi:2-succinyl-5-enolpyruvyl-6-hydroxy-3-cyclohexene-1-carboxylate synthase